MLSLNMAQLIVRNIDDGLKAKLQMQAQQKGRSMEEEVRQILFKALTEKNLKAGDLIASHFQNLDFDFELQRMDKTPLRVAEFEK